MTGLNSMRNHVLTYTCVPLLLIAVVLSCYRFVIARDYIVEYEAVCDPAVESCFVGCEDETCTEVYYYAVAEKHAADLYAACGADITDCADASVCLTHDRSCTITYCDQTTVAADETCAATDSEEPLTPEEL